MKDLMRSNIYDVYVIVENKMIEIDNNIISLSKSLAKLKNELNEGK